jgi:hypothetical protein
LVRLFLGELLLSSAASALPNKNIITQKTGKEKDKDHVPVHGILSYLPAFIGTKLGGDSP